jgi:tetratricopeptide (TPR) repeat protein
MTSLVPERRRRRSHRDLSWRSRGGSGPLPALFILLLLTAGCGKNGAGSRAPEETELGWAAWEAGEYTTARTRFLAAVSEDAGYAEAHHGLGWAHAFLGSLPQAVTAFTTARLRGLSTPDPDAGLAIVLRDLPDLDGAIASALAALGASSAWSFSHRPSIDWRDLRLILAQCYFRKGPGTFDEAQDQVDILDPTNGLDPASPATWTVGATTYDTYAEALLMAIEAQEAAIGG